MLISNIDIPELKALPIILSLLIPTIIISSILYFLPTGYREMTILVLVVLAIALFLIATLGIWELLQKHRARHRTVIIDKTINWHFFEQFEFHSINEISLEKCKEELQMPPRLGSMLYLGTKKEILTLEKQINAEVEKEYGKPYRHLFRQTYYKYGHDYDYFDQYLDEYVEQKRCRIKARLSAKSEISDKTKTLFWDYGKLRGLYCKKRGIDTPTYWLCTKIENTNELAYRRLMRVHIKNDYTSHHSLSYHHINKDTLELLVYAPGVLCIILSIVVGVPYGVYYAIQNGTRFFDFILYPIIFPLFGGFALTFFIVILWSALLKGLSTLTRDFPISLYNYIGSILYPRDIESDNDNKFEAIIAIILSFSLLIYIIVDQVLHTINQI